MLGKWEHNPSIIFVALSVGTDHDRLHPPVADVMKTIVPNNYLGQWTPKCGLWISSTTTSVLIQNAKMPHPTFTESEILGTGPTNCSFNKPSR